MTNYRLMGVVRSRNLFFNFRLNHVFGRDEARYFKFRVLIDTEEYY